MSRSSLGRLSQLSISGVHGMYYHSWIFGAEERNDDSTQIEIFPWLLFSLDLEYIDSLAWYAIAQLYEKLVIDQLVLSFLFERQSGVQIVLDQCKSIVFLQIRGWALICESFPL